MSREEVSSMKILSYIALIIAGICLLLALIGHFFFSGRVLFNWDKYIVGVIISLLTSIVFALYHMIELKSK